MERHYSDLLVKLVWFEGLCWSISTSSPDPRLVFSVCDPIEPQNHKPAGVGGTTCCVVLILWCVLKDYSQTLLPGERSSPSSPGEADDQLSRWRLHREPAGPVGPPCSSLERLWSNEPGLKWTQAWQIYLLRLVGFVRQRDDSLMNWLWFVFLIFSVSQWSCDDFLWTFPDGRLSGVTDWLQPTWRRRAALQRANGGLKRRLAATRLQKSEEEVKNTSCLSGLPAGEMETLPVSPRGSRDLRHCNASWVRSAQLSDTTTSSLCWSEFSQIDTETKTLCWRFSPKTET